MTEKRQRLPGIVVEWLQQRASAKPELPLPVGARSVGYRRVTPAFVVGPGHPFRVSRCGMAQLFWSIDGCGWIMLHGAKHRLPGGHVALFLPGDDHHYGADADWRFHWLTVDGPGLATCLEALRLPRLPFAAGPCPLAEFEQLRAEISGGTRRAEAVAAATALRILFLAAERAHADDSADPLVERAAEILRRRFRDPAFTVNELCRQLGRHRSGLSRAFTRAKGMPPARYLRLRRIEEAQLLLENTSLPIADVARACGFADPNYFSRAFSKAVGMSPLRFRRRQLSLPDNVR